MASFWAKGRLATGLQNRFVAEAKCKKLKITATNNQKNRRARVFLGVFLTIFKFIAESRGSKSSPDLFRRF
jgi:hypothetical protein